MSHVKTAPRLDHEGTLVIEFEVTPKRAGELAREDDPSNVTCGVGEFSEAGSVELRVVVSARGSTVDAFFRLSDVIGDPAWEQLKDGVTFQGFPTTIWRRQVVAEAFRRLAASVPLGVSRAPTGASVIRLAQIDWPAHADSALKP